MTQFERVYEEHSKQDGLRILVERLWPRGVSEEKAAIDIWLKDLAPARSFGHGSIVIWNDGTSSANLTGRN